jgi:hypothetical protein
VDVQAHALVRRFDPETDPGDAGPLHLPQQGGRDGVHPAVDPEVHVVTPLDKQVAEALHPLRREDEELVFDADIPDPVLLDQRVDPQDHGFRPVPDRGRPERA